MQKHRKIMIDNTPQTFRNHSINQIQPEESFGQRPSEQPTQKQCLFCSSKQLIMKQLSLLKQVVEDKNKKIRELQEFISKLSQMMLGQEEQNPSDFYDSRQNSKTRKIQQFLSSSGYQSAKQSCSDHNSSNSKAQIDSSMLHHQGQCDRITIKSDSTSNLKSQNTKSQYDDHRNELRKQIMKMDLDSQSQASEKQTTRKQFKLRQKLQEIINYMPQKVLQHTAKVFDTGSEPFSQAVPNHQKFLPEPTVKRSAFSRKEPSHPIFMRDSESMRAEQSIHSHQ